MHIRWTVFLLFAFTAPGFAWPERACAGPPRISGINPPAVQRDVGGTLQFYGKELGTGGQLLVPFEAEVRVEGGGKEAINISIKPASATAPGAYPVRYRTAEGISNLRLLLVTDVPVVRVKEPNGGYRNGTLDLATTQPVQWPCVICGNRLERDIDGYRFAVEPGDRLVFVTNTWRVGLTPDPILRLRDGRGRMLAYAHDTTTLQRDERLDFTFPTAGDHYLEMQSTGGGGWNNHYAVRIGADDYARTVFPLGGRRGETVTFQIMNRDGQLSSITTRIPDDLGSDEWRLPLPDHPASLPWLLACGDYPEVLEQVAAVEPQKVEPQKLEWPITVNGRISKPGEQDLYKLAVTPGQTLRARIEAFHQGSALDGYLLVYDPIGKKLLAKHDDSVGRGNPDPAVDFEVPEGVSEVIVAVRDTLNQGSSLHSYRLTIETGGPDFFLWYGNKQNPTNQEDDGWHRMDASDTLNLTPGQDAKLRLSVRRSAKADDGHYNGPIQGYTGPIVVNALHLPPGVTVQPLVIPEGATEAELKFHATAEAPREPFQMMVIGEAVRANGTSIRRIAERRLYLSDPALTNMPWNWRVQKLTCVVNPPVAALTNSP